VVIIFGIIEMDLIEVVKFVSDLLQVGDFDLPGSLSTLSSGWLNQENNMYQ
jgi:hypothetical protein